MLSFQEYPGLPGWRKERLTWFIRVLFVQGEVSGSITCCIEDTGVGRIRSAQYRNDLSGKTSRGIAIVSERLRLINHLRGTDYSIVVEDLHPDKEDTGTRVTIDIPLKI